VWLWRDRDRVTEGERKRRENSVFVVWRRDELSKVTVVHDGETIVLERDRASKDKRGEGKEGLWRMTSPRAERADPVAVERLLTTLEFSTVARKVSDGAATGLDAPRASGTVEMGGLAVAFALGGSSPRPEGSSYFRVGDEPPIVVSKELADGLLAPSDTYRDRTVVPYLATELARFEAKHPAGGMTLERIDDHSFRVAETGLLASRTAVDRLWASLAEMRAEAFPKDADVDRLTAHPVVSLKLTPKDGTKAPAELVIGEACPGHPNDVVILRKTPTRVAACAPGDVVGALVAGASSFVEKHPFTLRMDEIEELRLERSAAPAPGDDSGTAGDAGAPAPAAIEIARKGTGFHLRAPSDRDLTTAEADAASELITRIATYEATSVARGGAPFAAVGRALVHSGDRQQIVELGAPRSDGATLRRVLDDARLEVPLSVYRRLVPRATSLRARTALDGETRRPTRVVLHCGLEQELVDRGEGFRLVSPAGYDTDGAISQLASGISRGRIDSWVADRDDGSFGFTRDGCHVVVGFEDGNAPVTLWFGAEGEGGIYVRVDPHPEVLVAPRSLRDLAKSIYVSRASLRTEASRVERVSVMIDGKPAPARDPSALRDAVSSLFADRVVALKKPDGAPDLVLEVALTEGGPPKRISCRSISAAERHCAASGVNATFLVSESRLAPFLPPREASAAPSSSAP
jgi:hypothetical protein